MSLYHDLMNAQDGGAAQKIVEAAIQRKGGGDGDTLLDRPYLHFDLDAKIIILYERFTTSYCAYFDEGKDKSNDCKCNRKSLLFRYCNPALCFGKWLCDEGTRAGLSGDEAEVVTKAASMLRAFRTKNSDAPLQVQTKCDIIGSFFDGIVSTVPNKDRVLAEMGITKESFTKTLLSAVGAETGKLTNKE